MAKKTTDVTLFGDTSLPTALIDEIAAEEGMGYSEKSEDSMVPILSILQDNSAEVKKRHSKHIEGAEAGDLIIRSLGRVISMTESSPPIEIQPCGFDHMWVEWDGEPGEGVPVGQYPFDELPEDATETENADGNKEWRMPSGTRLVDTRYHYVNLIEEDGSILPLVVPMGGSNHGVSRQWTAQMKQFTVPGRAGMRAKSFMRTYGLRTQFNQRGEQSWFKYAVSDLGWVRSEEILSAGLDLFRAVREQTVAAETTVAAGEDKTEVPI